MLDKMVELAKDFEELYKESGLCGVSVNSKGAPSIQLTQKEFLERFPSGYETVERGCYSYPSEHAFELKGVRFFCVFM